MRVLVLAHGHPELSAGGGERAAYALFKRLKQSSGITHAAFAAYASAEAKRQESAQDILRRSDEYLVTLPPVDGFTFQTYGFDELKSSVEDLVAATQPDVVHIHHFLFWGLEVIELFKKAGVRVVLTLHEYAAICARYGQMVTSGLGLCHSASPDACGSCFPQLGAGQFFVRTTIAHHLLGQADHFIAPSSFLQDRYISWGLPADQITVIENTLDPTVRSQAQELLKSRHDDVRNNSCSEQMIFGYFAQINPFKGYDVLLEAAALLPAAIRQRMTIHIHGDNVNYRETPFHRRTDALFAKALDCVTPMGAYRSEDVLARMLTCDWVIVPSIWWENSPVVMQEARLAGRPMIVSDIGGMAEKIDPAVDRQFPVGDPAGLARLMTEIVVANDRSDAKLLRTLTEERLLCDAAELACHVSLYEAVLAK